MGAEFAAKYPKVAAPAPARGRQVRGPARRAAARRVRLPGRPGPPEDRRRVPRDHRRPARRPRTRTSRAPCRRWRSSSSSPAPTRPKLAGGLTIAPGPGSTRGRSRGLPLPVPHGLPGHALAGRGRVGPAQPRPGRRPRQAARGGRAAAAPAAMPGGRVRRALGLDRLRFYLDGEAPAVHALYELLFNRRPARSSCAAKPPAGRRPRSSFPRARSSRSGSAATRGCSRTRTGPSPATGCSRNTSPSPRSSSSST